MRKKVATEVNPTDSDCRFHKRSSDRRFRFRDKKVGRTGDGYMRDRWWMLAMGTAWRNVDWKGRCHCCNGGHSGVHMEETPSYPNGKQDTTLAVTA